MVTHTHTRIYTHTHTHTLLGCCLVTILPLPQYSETFVGQGSDGYAPWGRSRLRRDPGRVLRRMLYLRDLVLQLDPAKIHTLATKDQPLGSLSLLLFLSSPDIECAL